ncbi:VENN motif pre-toxin domain-containing protein, partial [[Pasteurella] aerogenes]
ETTTLKGATANINHLALDTKNLHIESVQDIEKYDSKQTQGGVKAAFAWGSGASGSVQFSRNKANVDYAQVNQQSGFNINESSDINVKENTHLKGGVINAEGKKENHHLTTGTLTTENIENRSDIKVSSISAGVSSDMTQMATMAVGAALSALGNMSESERSQTQAAISHNVNVQITDSEAQKQKTGKTAEETLQSLNRDVANANQKLEKQDLQALQERQEMAQVIGELSQAGINHLVGDKLKEADKKRQEADAIEKENPTKATALRAQAQAIEAEYGLGSNLQMGIRAATAALQGLATGSVNQAAVGAVSPYLNKLIKEQTGDNKEANLIAHAVLGAVEAHITGNNAAAGALGALTAEAAAPLIMQTLYGTEKPENLTDSQKQNVANLSQIAAGLSGGLVGDSTGSFVAGAEIGKRAVENNYLYRQEAEELLNLRLALQQTTDPKEREKIQAKIDKLEKLDQDRQEHIKTACPDFGKSSSACSAAIADAEKAKASYNGWTEQYQPVGYNSKDKRPYTTIFTQDYGRVNEALVGKDELTRQKEELALDLAKSGQMSKEDAYRILDNSMTLSDTLMALGGIKTVSNEKFMAFLTGKYKLPVIGKTQGYEYGDVRISSGAENVALYPKLKEQLRLENLQNISNEYPILKHAALGEGNLTEKGIFTKTEIEKLAKEWVGEGYKITSQGGFISADGTRRYRPPSTKVKSSYAITGVQANFERGHVDLEKGTFIPESNLHLNIYGESK